MIYKTIKEFYADNIARRSSGEADYGCWWTDEKLFPYHRVSYVHATGEIYAVQLGVHGDDFGQVEVLGVVPPDEGRIYYRSLDRLLDGWEKVSTRPLSWVRSRLKEVTKDAHKATKA